MGRYQPGCAMSGRAVRKPASNRPAKPPKPEGDTALQIKRDPTKSEELQTAEVLLDPSTLNAVTALRFFDPNGCRPDLNGAVQVVTNAAAAIQANDMRGAEAILSGQAIALNAMFVELTRRGSLNISQNLEAAQIYLRLALKCQSQSRATLETLGALKNPAVVFARPANFSNGGPQQVVNNGLALRAGEIVSAPTEQISAQPAALEDLSGSQMDSGAESSTGRADPWLATVGALNRASNGGGQGVVQDEPLPRRQAACASGVRQNAAGATRASRRSAGRSG